MSERNSSSLAWALGLWGAFSVIIGALVLAWPGITLKVLLILMGINFIATGAVIAIGSLVDRRGHWIGGILIGVLSLLAGMYVFANPQTSALVLLYLIAIWAIAVGSIQVISGFESRNDKGWLVVSGLVSILFGLFIFARPLEGALALIWAIGLFSIIQGVVIIVTAFKSGGDSAVQVATGRKA